MTCPPPTTHTHTHTHHPPPAPPPSASHPSPLQRERFLAYYPAHSSGVTWIILVSSSIAVCYNLTHSTLIKRTSAVTTTVLGEIKIIGLLILSTILLGAGDGGGWGGRRGGQRERTQCCIDWRRWRAARAGGLHGQRLGDCGCGHTNTTTPQLSRVLISCRPPPPAIHTQARARSQPAS